jgi:hypothetical protein
MYERVDSKQYFRGKTPIIQYKAENIIERPPIQRHRARVIKGNIEDADNTYEDDYGRPLRAEIPIGTLPFHGILLDNAFGVIRESYDSQDPSEVQHMPVLQLWTWRTELHVVVRESTTTTAVSRLSVCDIVDKKGDWCGSIVLAEQWIRESQGSLFQFIAISDAKAFSREEWPVWTYYIPKERDESDWDLYYFMLLERNVERFVWERAGLGKVSKAAFKNKTWDEIKLG